MRKLHALGRESTFLESLARGVARAITSDRVDEAAQLAIAALRGLALERTVEGSRSSKKQQREIVLRSVLDILGVEDI